MGVLIRQYKSSNNIIVFDIQQKGFIDVCRCVMCRQKMYLLFFQLLIFSQSIFSCEFDETAVNKLQVSRILLMLIEDLFMILILTNQG